MNGDSPRWTWTRSWNAPPAGVHASPLPAATCARAPDMHANLDSAEIAKFDAIAARWWDPEGEFRPLHAINPLRLDYVDSRAPLQGRRVLDIGCGGGLLAEGMASRGAKVMGIDLSEGALKVAKLHLKESGRQVEYRLVSAEALAAEMPGAFDIVTCMEMLEHVPDPASV